MRTLKGKVIACLVQNLIVTESRVGCGFYITKLLRLRSRPAYVFDYRRPYLTKFLESFCPVEGNYITCVVVKIAQTSCRTQMA